MSLDSEESASPLPDAFEQRKKQVIQYLKDKKDYLLLALVIYIGAFIRSQNLRHLRDITTGNYISLELDSTLFYRYAQYIAEHGKLFLIDPLRNYPLGVEISFGVFTSYFVAYLYKFLHIFIPSITVEFVDVIYPIIATAVMTLFLFLLIRRLFDYRVALLTAAIVNVIPAFLFRSLGGSSDHDILGMMFVFITFYFYVVGWQSSKKRSALLFGLFAGISASIGLSAAGLVNFVFIIIGLFSLVEVLLNKTDKKDFYLLLSFTVTSLLFWHYIVGRPYTVFFGSISTMSTAIALITIGFYQVVQQPLFKKYLDKIHYIRNLPPGIQAFFFSILVTLILGLLFQGPAFIQAKIAQISDEIFKTSTRFTVNRWIITVAENKRPYVTDWFSQYGKFFVYSFIAGSILLFYDMVKQFEKAKHLTLVYGLFIFGYVFTRYSSSSVFNGDTTLSKQVFYGAILFFVGTLSFLYFYAYYKKPEMYDKIKTIDKKYVFVFLWFLVKILAATSAIRLLFEFTTITAMLVSFLFVSLFDFALKFQEKYLRWTALALILLIIFSPFSSAQGLLVSYYHNSLSQARGSGPGYNQQWQYAGKWVRENTPQNAVFAHWWDYGYWVQSGFQRPTITDGGNLIAWWNYLMGRHVLTAQNDTEPLKFLYGHNASYLLMVQDEVGKYGAYASIGSNANYDRFSFIPTFQLNQQATQERRNQTILLYQGGFPLDEDIFLNGKLFPKGQAGIGAVLVPMETAAVQNGEQTTQGTRILQPSVALIYQNQRFDLPLQCIYIQNQKYEFENYTIGGCLRIVPTVSNNQMNPLGAALYLSQRTYTTLFSQLYLLDAPSDYFHLVYDDSKQVPLMVYNGMLVGPIRVWRVTYPKDLHLTKEDYQYYVGQSYTDDRLTMI